MWSWPKGTNGSCLGQEARSRLYAISRRMRAAVNYLCLVSPCFVYGGQSEGPLEELWWVSIRRRGWVKVGGAVRASDIRCIHDVSETTCDDAGLLKKAKYAECPGRGSHPKIVVFNARLGPRCPEAQGVPNGTRVSHVVASAPPLSDRCSMLVYEDGPNRGCPAGSLHRNPEKGRHSDAGLVLPGISQRPRPSRCIPQT